MLRGNRGDHAALVLVGLIFVLLAFAIGLSNQRNYCSGGNGAPGYEACESDNTSFRFPAPAANEKPSRDEWRQERDLQAQRDMAEWARWMFISSTAGVVVSLFALFLISGTLEESRKATAAAQTTADAAIQANKDFEQISKRQLRAYVSVTASEPIWHTLVGQPDKPPFNVEFKFTVTNSGQTPAFSVKADALPLMIAQDAFGGPLQIDRVATPGAPEISLGMNGSMTAGPSQMPVDLILRNLKEGRKLAIHLRITYADAFGDEHVTEHCAVLGDFIVPKNLAEITAPGRAVAVFKSYVHHNRMT